MNSHKDHANAGLQHSQLSSTDLNDFLSFVLGVIGIFRRHVALVVFSFIFLYSWQISSDGHNTTPVPLDATLLSSAMQRFGCGLSPPPKFMCWRLGFQRGCVEVVGPLRCWGLVGGS